jgi:hypothetical protein
MSSFPTSQIDALPPGRLDTTTRHHKEHETDWVREFEASSSSLPAHLHEEQVDLGWNVGTAEGSNVGMQKGAYPFSRHNPFLNGEIIQISSSNPSDSILALEAILQESPQNNSDAWYRLGVKHQGVYLSINFRKRE